MKQQLMVAFRVTLVMTILTGLIYPGVVTVIGQALFHDKANGSLVTVNGKVIGSDLIGQKFAKPEYFQPRPSAAGDGYDATASGGSNLGPTSKKLADRINDAAAAFRKDNPDYSGPIPADLLTASGSGLDPHISPANADAQAARVAKARGVSLAEIQSLIGSTTEAPDLGLLGEPRVNVLRLNIALDTKLPKH